MSKKSLDGADRVVAAHLAEEDGSKPAPAIEGSAPGVAVMSGDDGLEFGTWNQLDDLGKYSRLRHGSDSSWEGFAWSQSFYHRCFQAFFALTLCSEPDSSDSLTKTGLIKPAY